MSVNKYKPHLHVLPEDDANRQIANGFLLNPNLNNRAIQILPPSGGWKKAIELFKKTYLSKMRSYKNRMFLLLIDFDNHKDRLEKVCNEIPQDMRSRVFILGAGTEPENLIQQSKLKSLEHLGKALAEDCANDIANTWNHPLLVHNKDELKRMIKDVKPFLFS
jgi:hypothetical protein